MRAPTAYTVKARNLATDSDNKIHDDDVARQFGFTGALVPGVEVFAYATQPFAAAWGVDFLDRGLIAARFRRPVYDGDEVVVGPVPGDGGYELTVTGHDGVVRAVGTASLPDRRQHVDRTPFVETPAVDPIPPASDESLAPGTRLGTTREDVTVDGHRDYLDGIGEDLPLYRDGGHVHPGALLRMVNAVLFRSVALGPWIHTASTCRLLGAATAPTTLTAHGIVTDNYVRNGNAYVRFDALVLAGDRPAMHADHVAIYRIASRELSDS